MTPQHTEVQYVGFVATYNAGTPAYLEVKTYSMAGMRNVTLFYKGMAVVKVAWRNMPRRTAGQGQGMRVTEVR